MNLPGDVMKAIYDFGSENFLFFGSVSKQFRYSCEDCKTCVVNCLESRSKTEECLKSGGRARMGRVEPFRMIASGHGAFESAECLLSNGFDWDLTCIHDAVDARNFEFIGWIQGLMLEWYPQETYSVAARVGDLECAKYLYSLGCSPEMGVASVAADYGQTQFIEWLQHVNCPVSTVVEVFASNGDLKKVVWANRRGLSCTKPALDAAAYSRNDVLVSYMLGLGLVPDEKTLESACVGGAAATIELLFRDYQHLFGNLSVLVGDLLVS